VELNTITITPSKKDSTSKTIKFYTPNIINMKNVDVQMYGLSAEVKTTVQL
jgi:uncharacterized protein YlaN (UPF0358 family)